MYGFTQFYRWSYINSDIITMNLLAWVVCITFIRWVWDRLEWLQVINEITLYKNGQFAVFFQFDLYSKSKFENWSPAIDSDDRQARQRYKELHMQKLSVQDKIQKRVQFLLFYQNFSSVRHWTWKVVPLVTMVTSVLADIKPISIKLHF